MRYLTILILISCKLAFGQDKKQKEALELIECLKTERIKNSKQYHVVSNSYLLTDLNNDNIFEVVEIINKIEDEFSGFLPIELSSAFDYHKVYSFDKENNKFILSKVSNFNTYKIGREYFYKAWYSLILNPKGLSNNLQSFINENKELFLHELNKLIKEVNK